MNKKVYNVYKITYNGTPIYIGCTSQGLNKRFYQHQTMKDSLVYQSYSSILSQLNISFINVLVKNDNVFSTDISNSKKAFELEELLTYIYGYNYKLVNINAGNRIYRKTNMEMFSKVHDFLYRLLECEYILNNETFVEIVWCIGNICGYYMPKEYLEKIVFNSEAREALLKKIDDGCCALLCEAIDDDF